MLCDVYSEGNKQVAGRGNIRDRVQFHLARVAGEGLLSRNLKGEEKEVMGKLFWAENSLCKGPSKKKLGISGDHGGGQCGWSGDWGETRPGR